MKKEAERALGDVYARLAWAKKGGIGMSKLRWPARILAVSVAHGVAFFGLMFVASESEDAKERLSEAVKADMWRGACATRKSPKG